MSTQNTNFDRGRLEALEAHLAGALKPISPPKDYVRRLRERIRIPQREEIAGRLRDWQTLLLVFGGIFSGAVAALAVARALYHVFGRRHVA